MAGTHPCLSCGACCAAFRVDFSVYESQENGGRVPLGLIEPVTNSPAACAAPTTPARAAQH